MLNGWVCSSVMDCGVIWMEVLKGTTIWVSLDVLSNMSFFSFILIFFFKWKNIFFMMEEKTAEVKAGGPN